jgi:hypothetical protein
MHFNTKNYLKNNYNHTVAQPYIYQLLMSLKQQKAIADSSKKQAPQSTLGLH